MFRNLNGIVRVDGKDAEDIGSDEWVHTAHVVGILLPVGEPSWRPLNIPHVRWGGECRVEIDVSVRAMGDRRVAVSGWAYFYEGASEDTGEEEDRTQIDFIVPRNTSTLQNPFVIPYELRNRVLIGAEDHATVTFSLKNDIVEED